jgi:hypothetical protein
MASVHVRGGHTEFIAVCSLQGDKDHLIVDQAPFWNSKPGTVTTSCRSDGGTPTGAVMVLHNGIAVIQAQICRF